MNRGLGTVRGPCCLVRLGARTVRRGSAWPQPHRRHFPSALHPPLADLSTRPFSRLLSPWHDLLPTCSHPRRAHKRAASCVCSPLPPTAPPACVNSSLSSLAPLLCLAVWCAHKLLRRPLQPTWPTADSPATKHQIGINSSVAMNHGYPPRGIGAPPPGGPSQRLNELLDSIRAEFDGESQRIGDYESQSESFLPAHVGVQVRSGQKLATGCYASWLTFAGHSLATHPRNRNDPRQGVFARATARECKGKVSRQIVYAVIQGPAHAAPHCQRIRIHAKELEIDK
jgi:hypothetical protein